MLVYWNSGKIAIRKRVPPPGKTGRFLRGSRAGRAEPACIIFTQRFYICKNGVNLQKSSVTPVFAAATDELLDFQGVNCLKIAGKLTKIIGRELFSPVSDEKFVMMRTVTVTFHR